MKCTHEGTYASAGVIPIQGPGGNFIIGVLFCTHCGELSLRVARLELQAPDGKGKNENSTSTGDAGATTIKPSGGPESPATQRDPGTPAPASETKG